MIITTTGGRGFIGSHFIELCLAKGHTIIDIDFMGYCANKINNIGWYPKHFNGIYKWFK